MTWGEFKEWVNRQEIPNDDEVQYIDFSWVDKTEQLSAYPDKIRDENYWCIH